MYVNVWLRHRGQNVGLSPEAEVKASIYLGFGFVALSLASTYVTSYSGQLGRQSLFRRPLGSDDCYSDNRCSDSRCSDGWA